MISNHDYRLHSEQTLSKHYTSLNSTHGGLSVQPSVHPFVCHSLIKIMETHDNLIITLILKVIYEGIFEGIYHILYMVLIHLSMGFCGYSCSRKAGRDCGQSVGARNRSENPEINKRQNNVIYLSLSARMQEK